MKYDFLLVGAGLYNAVIAEQAQQKGKKCLVIERRSHVGGNIYTENIEGINVHKYGAHIFHTDDKNIWNYINQFAAFNNYINSPIANNNGHLYNLPFNMNTFTKIWPELTTPEQVKKRIQEQSAIMNGKKAKNLEEQAISFVGKDIYEILIKGYTEKQWGKKCSQLSPAIIKRLPVRYTFNNNYFNDRYQGIPIGGYTQIIEKMFENSDIILNTDFLEGKNMWLKQANKIIYTGTIDRYFDYCLGNLEYRSLRFKTEILNTDNYQGNAVINYTNSNIPYTRIIEHKHFEFGNQPKTVITKEYPKNWQNGDEPFYTINDKKNTQLYDEYRKLAEKQKKIIFGGRLGSYKYYDMDDTIIHALNLCKDLF